MIGGKVDRFRALGYDERMDHKKFEQLLALFLIFIGVVVRLLPHGDNFAPLTALALFSGAVVSPGAALSVPVLAIMASDLWIGPHDLFWLVWGCFLLTVGIGFWVKKNPGALNIVLGTFAGSVLFFILTNLGVFLFENMYPKSFSGLVECYAMALPFFRNSLAGDFFYAVVFFGSYNLALRFVCHSRESGNQI